MHLPEKIKFQEDEMNFSHPSSEYWSEIISNHRNNWLRKQFDPVPPFNRFIRLLIAYEQNSQDIFDECMQQELTKFYSVKPCNHIVLNAVQCTFVFAYQNYLKPESVLYKYLFE